MNSQVIRAQTDEDTFFVLVEDTVSLQSYDSDDKPTDDCNEKKYCLTDEAVQCDCVDEINQHFLDEIMSAMEDENVDVLLNETDEPDDDEESTILLDVHPNININNFIPLDGKDTSQQYLEDTISVASRNSDFSNKSFVFVSSNDRQTSVENNELMLNTDSTSNESLKQFEQSLCTGRTDDVISIDGLKMFEHPTLEYDDTWQLCSQSSPVKMEEPQKIIIRELSYDEELKDVEGIDLMAPVFLAITGESGDHITDMKRKAKSIEDLCSVTLNEDGRYRRRSRSDATFQQKLKSIKYIKAKQCANLNKVIDTEDFRSSFDDSDTVVLTRNASIKSHISFDDLHLSSTSSGHLHECDGNELFEDPDVYIDDVYEEGYASNDFSGEMISLTYPSDIETNNPSKTCESWKKFKASECDHGATVSVSSGEDEITVETTQASPTQPHMFKYKDKKGDLKRSPRCIPGTQCGFLEYPYGERSPLGSPHKVRRLVGCNTSPGSPAPQTGGLHDRIVVNINGDQRIIDMPLIEPYLKVLSHGGHHRIGNECRDIVVFAACFLPSKTIEKYTIIMEQLFFYCIHAVDLLVNDSYEIVFFNSALESKNMPARKWIKQYYDLVFYRLKKNLKDIYFVHQSLWLKAALRFSKLFVSSKFRRKIHLIQNIQALKKYVPLDYIFIPPNITKVDETFQ